MNWEKYSNSKVNLGIAIALSLFSFGFSDQESAWKRAWPHLGLSQARKVMAEARSDSGFWLLTSHALYHLDGQNQASLVLHQAVNDIYQDSNDPDTAYIAGEEGIYKRQGSDLRKIFHRHGCLCVWRSNGKILAGTSHGLWIGEEARNNWRSLSGALGQKQILRLASWGDVVYVVTPAALYRYDATSGEYKEIFTTGISREVEREILNDEKNPEGKVPDILDVDVTKDSVLYVASLKGIYLSNNTGNDWERLSENGLPLQSLKALTIDDEQKLWAATTEGLYRLAGQRWERSVNGLESNVVYDVARDNHGDMYAATERGFFYLPKNESATQTDHATEFFKNYADLEKYFENEPTVREVQEMAVRYADVHPDKIKRWHRQSRLKAFVPTVSTGFDRNATDLMHWDTGPNPDQLAKGRDFIDWDVNLSWNLGDMVWSSDQTSIDSRSKLMVELREEVLDQVTRVYFERRRLQITLLGVPKEAGSVIDDQLRLEELTAVIDGFTGGEFSHRIWQNGERV